MTTGQEEQVLQNASARGTIIDELQASAKECNGLDLEGTYGKINEIMINRLIHFEQARLIQQKEEMSQCQHCGCTCHGKPQKSDARACLMIGEGQLFSSPPVKK